MIAATLETKPNCLALLKQEHKPQDDVSDDDVGSNDGDDTSDTKETEDVLAARSAGDLLLPLMKSIYSNAERCVGSNVLGTHGVQVQFRCRFAPNCGQPSV